ncbi:ABC transporter permease [[Clostridium] dakarense]|uniref:ABC transporter permease n=1 Tax=Faecalimicrobium dakarense TaxID=1301100 RepID=UPI0004AC7D80|nr:ABC transporter permease [[Clostridium] dakarense]
MFISMVIKELKLFSRNKGSLVMMFAFPIILITILGVALENMIGGDINIFDDSKVLYIIEDSKYEDGFKGFKETMEDEFEGLIFEETKNIEESKKLVLDNKAMCFISVNKDGYSYFRNENREYQNSKIFRSIFEGVIDKYALVDVVMKNDPTIISSITKDEANKYTDEISVGNRAITSIDYYTFAELALIILYVSAIVGESVVNEKELGTFNRISLSNTSTLKLILSKMTLGLIIVAIQILVVYFYSTIVLKAHWGDNLLFMIFNLLCLGVFSSVLGVVVGMIIKDGKTLNGILNVVIVIMCLFGGCYTPLSMVKSIPVLGDVAIVSPVYWINSSLISLSTGVVDTYSKVAISITLGLSVILVGIYLIYSKIKRRDNLV